METLYAAIRSALQLFFIIRSDFSYTSLSGECRLPHLTIELSWLFPWADISPLTSEQPYGLLPGRPIAQAVSVPHSPSVLINYRLIRIGVHLFTVKFLPNYRIGQISPKVFSWNPLTSIV